MNLCVEKWLSAGEWFIHSFSPSAHSLLFWLLIFLVIRINSNIWYSWLTSLIHFIEHNDANQALMTSNVQRQAILLSWSEKKCIVRRSWPVSSWILVALFNPIAKWRKKNKWKCVRINNLSLRNTCQARNWVSLYYPNIAGLFFSRVR